MRLGTWNLLHGVDLTSGTAASEEALAAAAERLDCDVLAIQEVDCDQPRSHGLNQTKVMASALGANYWRFVPSLAGTPGEAWEPHHHMWDGPSYGIGLISRIPVKQWHHMRLAPARLGLPLLLPTERGPRMKYVSDEPRIALAAELEGLTVACVHLSFVPGRNIRQLRQVIRWLKSLPGPRILMGDFNLPGSIPSRVSRWSEAARSVTYPAWQPKVQFDHILLEEERKILAVDQPKTGLSDHLPLIVTT